MQTQYELFPNLPVVRNPSTYWARYKAYLRSVRWKEIAEATKRAADFQCEYFGPTCTRSTHLECHHRTYVNIFREHPGDDTMCVCRNCHIYIHAHLRLSADNDNRKSAPAEVARVDVSE
jgi:hypothetical protein